MTDLSQQISYFNINKEPRKLFINLDKICGTGISEINIEIYGETITFSKEEIREILKGIKCAQTAK